jgi:hypothetical protein
MDNAFDSFHDRIVAAIRTGDVICLFFPRLGKTLILDLRRTDTVPAALFVENMVSSPEERLRSLERLRPDLPLPEEVRLAPWFGFARSLPETEVYTALVERCEEAGGAELAARCHAAVEALTRLELRFIRAIVKGEMSRTIWQRAADR